jgi:Glycosyl transferases group 1
MSGRLKTLILDADGGGWSYVAADTLLRGLLKSRIDVSSLPRAVQSNRWCRRLLGPRYRHLSYVLDWREALREAPELDVEMCNINNLLEYRRRREAIRHYPLIIVLHSAAGDSMGLLQQTAHWFEGRRGRLVVFLGNEYDLMDRKVAFLRSAGADCICSQLPIEAAEWIYADCRPARILSMPHALNPRLYSPGPAVARRVDIGFCGDVYHPFVGDIERNRLLRFFEEHGCELGLELDFRLNARMERTAWAAFLRQCAATVGAESGTYYLDRRGGLIRAAKAYVARHPRVSFEEIFDRFFRNPTVPYVSGKAISSRHFEPIGTKTCQLLLEGHYNGILRPNEHYIPINKDLSNVREAVERFRDESLRTRIVEQAYEYVMDEHTYRHRVASLIRTVSQSGPMPLVAAGHAAC